MFTLVAGCRRLCTALVSMWRRVRTLAVQKGLKVRARHSKSWWFVHLTGFFALLVVAVGFGATTATATGAIGPHQTRFEMTTNGRFTLDLGPLGSLVMESTLPLGLGVTAVVQEIPQDATDVTNAQTLEALQDDLDQYVGFFSSVPLAVAQVQQRLIADALTRALYFMLVSLLAFVTLRVTVGPARRTDLTERLVSRVVTHRRATAALTAATLIACIAFVGFTDEPEPLPGVEPTVAVFDGTPLAGAHITGRLGGLVDTYSGRIVDAYDRNLDFYVGAADELERSWYQWRGQVAAEVFDDPAAAPTPGSGHDMGADGVTAVPTEPGADVSEPTATTAATPTDTASMVDTPFETPTVAVVLVSDLHCNVGMAQVLGRLVDLSRADVVVDAGDTTVSGTSVEESCVQAFAAQIPDDVPLVAIAGNHDSRTTSAAYAQAGAIMLDNEVVTVAGIRFYGEPDPFQSHLGATTRTMTVAAAQASTGVNACAAPADVMVIHNPRLAQTALETPCAPADLSGHLHTRHDPQQIGRSIRYISGSSAGAAAGSPTIGPLANPAELTVLQWDPLTKLFVSWQLIVVNPDGTVEVNRAQAWPTIGAEAVPADELAGGD